MDQATYPTAEEFKAAARQRQEDRDARHQEEEAEDRKHSAIFLANLLQRRLKITVPLEMIATRDTRQAEVTLAGITYYARRPLTANGEHSLHLLLPCATESCEGRVPSDHEIYGPADVGDLLEQVERGEQRGTCLECQQRREEEAEREIEGRGPAPAARKPTPAEELETILGRIVGRMLNEHVEQYHEGQY